MLSKFGDGVLSENVGGEALCGRFARDGFGAVFTKLGCFAFSIWIGPRTTGAVEPVFLIHFEQRVKAPLRSHFTDTVVRRFVDAQEPGGSRVAT
jgi:hypothetical protein